ncbi:hypothetical protein EDB85DRAFT_2196118 [Lactarius pseudohatsudake]|nr:hypothetical protein EDB85DRAFT_2196118 [Lactarius pseudohatsudake]
MSQYDRTRQIVITAPPNASKSILGYLCRHQLPYRFGYGSVERNHDPQLLWVSLDSSLLHFALTASIGIARSSMSALARTSSATALGVLLALSAGPTFCVAIVENQTDGGGSLLILGIAQFFISLVTTLLFGIILSGRMFGDRVGGKSSKYLRSLVFGCKFTKSYLFLTLPFRDRAMAGMNCHEGSTYKRAPIHFYNPHTAPLLDHYRLKVPAIRSVLEYFNFLILFILFVITVELNEVDRLNAWEVAFMIYSLGFSFEKAAAMQEHGIRGDFLRVSNHTPPSQGVDSILHRYLDKGFLVHLDLLPLPRLSIWMLWRDDFARLPKRILQDPGNIRFSGSVLAKKLLFAPFAPQPLMFCASLFLIWACIRPVKWKRNRWFVTITMSTADGWANRQSFSTVGTLLCQPSVTWVRPNMVVAVASHILCAGQGAPFLSEEEIEDIFLDFSFGFQRLDVRLHNGTLTSTTRTRSRCSSFPTAVHPASDYVCGYSEWYFTAQLALNDTIGHIRQRSQSLGKSLTGALQRWRQAMNGDEHEKSYASFYCIAYLEEELQGWRQATSTLPGGHSESAQAQVPDLASRKPHSRQRQVGQPELRRHILPARQLPGECLEIRDVLAEFEEYSVSSKSPYAKWGQKEFMAAPVAIVGALSVRQGSQLRFGKILNLQTKIGTSTSEQMLSPLHCNYGLPWRALFCQRVVLTFFRANSKLCRLEYDQYSWCTNNTFVILAGDIMDILLLLNVTPLSLPLSRWQVYATIKSFQPPRTVRHLTTSYRAGVPREPVHRDKLLSNLGWPITPKGTSN